jgi:hypothetical protein
MNFELNTPNVSAPSISSASMLVELSISTWTARKLDKSASADVTARNSAARGTANVNKKLLGDCEELVALQKFAGNVRTMHYSMTMPWSDTGMRLLPTAVYFKYHQQMTALQNEFARLVDAFLDAYDWEVVQAQSKLGTLFHRDEYPSVDSLRDKFGFRMSYIPLPDAGDWRVDMERDAQDALKQQYADFYRKQVEGAMRDVWERLHTEITRFIKQLDVDAEGRKGKIFDSTMEHVLHLTNMLEAANFTNDPNLQLAQHKIRAALDGVDRMDLVRNDGFRASTKRAMEDAIAALPGLGM